MSTVRTSTTDGIAVVTLAREKVNAINETLLDDLDAALDRIEVDPSVDGVVLTGRDRFFSFGFDVPELLAMPRDALASFLRKHTATLLRLFTFPRPVVAAVNGHATAGGCMLIMACDERVAAEGRAKVGLNEIDLGVSVFAGSAEMLRYRVGNRNAERILNEGTLYSVAEASSLGMVDEVVTADRLMEAATARARLLGGKPRAAYCAIKQLMRGGVTEKIVRDEKTALEAFVETWLSAEAQSILAGVEIRR